MQKNSFKNNLLAYFVSMRWYAAFVSGMAGWLGITFATDNINVAKQIAVLSILFIGWGINQVINDYLGLPEDRINAPYRPMVTGKLDTTFAISLTMIIEIGGLFVTYWLNKEAIIFYILFLILNVLYERAKRMPLLGNIVFGLLIAQCVYYSAMCVNGHGFLEIISDSKISALAMLVWLVNFAQCFFADFKDFEGDKKVNIKTLVVLIGPQKAKYLGFILIALPFLCLFYFLRLSVFLPFGSNGYFLAMLFLSFLSFLYPAFLFFKYPSGQNTYYSLKWVIIGVSLFETTLIGLVNPGLSAILFLVNLVGISSIFCLYKDPLS